MLAYLVLVALVVAPCALYLHRVERAIRCVPPEAAAAAQHYSDDEILATARQLKEQPVSTKPFLGERTGRRYIVVGGSGFVGGWIVLQLLSRGEDPRRIRILDLRSPSRPDLIAVVENGVTFVQTNIADEASVEAAFSVAWPEGNAALHHGLTVFHTASLIRYIERAKFLLPPIEKVNVHGTKIIVEAARRAGATVLVYTSSGSVGLQGARWMSLWWKWPANFVQYLNDDDLMAPKTFKEFFSNYAVTKFAAEQIVKAAHDINGMRTLCVRPSNAIYGSGGDALADAYMHRGTNPTWTVPMIQNCIHVENCAIAHLCAETALLAPAALAGGRSFYVCDPNPPIYYGDLYRTLNLLSGGRVSFPYLHAGFVFALAHMLEAYHLLRTKYLSLLPPLPGDVLLLQPATFMLVTVHAIFSDAGARRSVEEGGLGYKSPYTSLQGMVWTAVQHEEDRKINGARAFTFNYGMGAGPMNLAAPPAKVR